MNQELRIKNNNSTLKTIIHDSCFVILKSKGFTLIELLVVIIIIGILSSFVSITLFGGLARSRDAQRKNDLKQLRTALQLYYQDYNTYPPSCVSNNDVCWTNLLGDNRYIKTIPKDPINDPLHLYKYCLVEESKYVIVANLENTEDPEKKENNLDCSTDDLNRYWVTSP